VEWFEPVCGADRLTYFSPCYAGCHDFLADGVSSLSLSLFVVTIVNFICPKQKKTNARLTALSPGLPGSAGTT